jgi:hypothetical protein
MDEESVMSARERDELTRLTHERAKLESERVDALAAESVVELNRQLEAR